MTSTAAKGPAGRRSWLEPLLWLGIPALMAVVPWLVRQWTARPTPRPGSQTVTLHLTGDDRHDRLALLEQAWAAARPRPLPVEMPLPMQDRIARREAAWLAEIAVQLLPLDLKKAEQAAAEAIHQASDLPERIGPEDLVMPAETPTGRLLQLAKAFRAFPAVADRARRAALHMARAADRRGARVYALCLIARETEHSEPAFARSALQEARVRAEPLHGDEQLGALAALAGTAPTLISLQSSRPLLDRVLRGLRTPPHEPASLAVAASLIAPGAPEEAHRLAGEAVRRATVATAPPLDELPFRGPSDASFPGHVRLEPAIRFPSASRQAASPFRLPRTRVSQTLAADSQLRRVAAALALTDRTLALAAAQRIRRPQDRSGSFTELAALIEQRDPSQAAALYRLALQAADQIERPVAARRAALIRAATGLAAFDAPAALAVVQPLPPRLFALQLNDFIARLARQDPQEALRLIEREDAMQAGNSFAGFRLLIARAAVAEQLVRREPEQATRLLELPADARPGRRSVDGWLALARGLAGPAGPAAP